MVRDDPPSAKKKGKEKVVDATVLKPSSTLVKQLKWMVVKLLPKGPHFERLNANLARMGCPSLIYFPWSMGWAPIV